VKYSLKVGITKRRSPAWWAASIAIHVVLALVLVQIVFRYPLGQLVGIPEPEIATERVQFVRVPPPPSEASSGTAAKKPVRNAAPAPIQAPVAVPTTVPPPQQTDSSPSRAAGGTGTGLGVSGSGMATGIEPRQPDKRIDLTADVIIRTPRTVAEDVDSIVSLAIGIYRDSMGVYAQQKKAGEWTVKGKNGQTWGIDQKNIYLGKYKIPTALLSLLPLNVSAQSPIEARSAAYIRRDIMENAQRSISEDEFRAAVKRIRERKERERREKMVASDSKSDDKKPDVRP
jgi:hypothetical protein